MTRRFFSRILFRCALLLAVAGNAWADFSATYDFGSVTTASGTTDPTSVPAVANLSLGSFSAVGTPANPNAGGRFSFTDWATGGVNGSDTYSAHTGTVNTAEYYTVTLTPQAGYALNLNSLTFTIQRSGTGIRTYAVRSDSGADAFATNLPGSIAPANVNLSVQAGNVFYWNFDSQATAQNGSTVTLGAAFQDLTTPVTFRFYGWNAEGSGGTFSIDNVTFNGNVVAASGPVAPTINTPPSAVTITEGGTANFNVAASGAGALTYRWRRNGTDIFDGVTGTGMTVSGTGTAHLTLTAVPLSENGASYSVRVTDVLAATSAGAALTVNPATVPPSITTQPAPQSVIPGETATFTVNAAGTAPLTYQWRQGGVNLADGAGISGALTATLTIANVSAANVGNYSVVVSGTGSPVTSSDAALTLAALVNPLGQISYIGGNYSQDFNTLPSSGTFTLPSAGPLALNSAPINASGLGGWSLAKYDGSGAVALFRVDSGTGISGSIYSYGSASGNERSLGSLGSGSTVSRFGTTLVNNTGRTITEFTLSYTGEQWRRGTGAANTLTLAYALDATDINVGDFVNVPALSFTAPNTGANGALDGNGAGNRTSISGTVAGLTWLPGHTLVLRWTDTDDTGSDDGLAIDDLTFSTPVATGDLVPAVSFVVPNNGAVNVSPAAPLAIRFNEPVDVTGTWYTLTGSVSGAHAATVSGGPVAYTLTPSVAFAEGELVTLTVSAANVLDHATGTRRPTADFSAAYFTASTGPLPIHVIQGRGLTSMFSGTSVTIQGVVVGSFQGIGGIGGYYLEAPDAQQDGDPATSEGIYVFDNTNPVIVGDFVTVTGTVAEFGTAPNTETEIKDVTAFAKQGSGNALPTAAIVTLPFPGANFQERYEGMLVTLPQALTVSDNFDLGHFGEIDLSNGRLLQPTNVVAPGAPAQAWDAANRLNRITLDDGLSATYPDPTPFLSGGTRRAGSTATGVTGILDNRFGTYVIEPTQPVTFADAPRPSVAPSVGGSLRVAIGNVLNFFNGDGAGAGFDDPDNRGASSFAEFQRQREKTVAGILTLAPDIMGLTEVENDRISNAVPGGPAVSSYGPGSAINDLVSALNAAAPAGTTYAYVDASAVDIVTDTIHSAFIYRIQTVEAVGLPAMLDNVYFNNHARNPLAQTFRQKSTGGKLTVSINHFRAKASASSLTDGIVPNPNIDNGDGQGNNNYIRKKEAEALVAWLATDPTGSGDSDFLILGDLNAYAKEDPLVAIENAGFTNLTEHFEGPGGYSYAFDGAFGHLDHALASNSLLTQVTGAATWHVNSDEPEYYDYNVENKSAAQQAINVGTPFRYSDHDPVVVGLNLSAPPIITTQPVSQTTTVGASVTFGVVATGVPAPGYQWRKNGAPIEGATAASFSLASPLTSDAGDYDVVVTNALGTVTSDAATLTVNKANAALTLGGTTGIISQPYNGTPRGVTVITQPSGLTVIVTYNGSTTPPATPGTYAVVATVDDPNYAGSVTGTLVVTTTALVRHGPAISGGLDGSIDILTGENIALNGNAWISGDLLVPGTPAIRLNGHPTYAGTVDGSGAEAPANYQVVLNGNAVVRHVVRRTDPIAMPVVAAPPSPAGTRNVSLNTGTQSPGDFASLRNLTLNGNAGQVAVPPGTYGILTANGNGGFTLGVPNATDPAIYNLQQLVLTGSSELRLVGPVVLNLANGVSVNGIAGDADNPAWLTINVASEGVTLNGGAKLYGAVVAPNGIVTVNGASTLTGSVVADRLTINAEGMLKAP